VDDATRTGIAEQLLHRRHRTRRRRKGKDLDTRAVRLKAAHLAAGSATRRRAFEL
jgi:hypothetical protein